MAPSAIASPSTSASMCPLSASSASEPVMKPPMTSARKYTVVTASTIVSRRSLLAAVFACWWSRAALELCTCICSNTPHPEKIREQTPGECSRRAHDEGDDVDHPDVQTEDVDDQPVHD